MKYGVSFFFQHHLKKYSSHFSRLNASILYVVPLKVGPQTAAKFLQLWPLVNDQCPENISHNFSHSASKVSPVWKLSSSRSGRLRQRPSQAMPPPSPLPTIESGLQREPTLPIFKITLEKEREPNLPLFMLKIPLGNEKPSFPSSKCPLQISEAIHKKKSQSSRHFSYLPWNIQMWKKISIGYIFFVIVQNCTRALECVLVLIIKIIYTGIPASTMEGHLLTKLRIQSQMCHQHLKFNRVSEKTSSFKRTNKKFPVSRLDWCWYLTKTCLFQRRAVSTGQPARSSCGIPICCCCSDIWPSSNWDIF